MKNIEFEYDTLTEHGETVKIIRVIGYIDGVTFPTFKETLLKDIDEEHSSVVLNLSRCQYINSTGFGMIATACRKSNRIGKSFVLCALTSKVRHIYHLIGLDHIVVSYPDEKQAVEALTGA